MFLSRIYYAIAYLVVLILEIIKATIDMAIRIFKGDQYDPIVIDTLATVYEDLGRYEDALAQFEKCVKLLQEGGKDEQIKETTEKIEALKEKMKG